MGEDVVIVGSGIAGHALARELRRAAPDLPITLVCADGGEIYAKPTLSVALSQGKLPDAIPSAGATRFAEQQRIAMRTHTTVRALDTAARRIETDAGSLDFGRLVLALGARQIGLPGAAFDERMLSVNHLDDYRVFRAALDGRRRVLVLGAGFIGCEFACDLRQAGFEVELVDLAPRPLARFWPDALSARFVARLADAGIRWHLGVRIERLQREGDRVVAALSDGTLVHADLALSALGLAPCTELAREAGLRIGRGIAVDATLATSAPGVYALGDCAEIDGHLWPFVMPILHCARALARTLAGTPTPIAFPPMPIVLKTPACPAAFLPAPSGANGTWQLDGEDCAVLRDPSGEAIGVALLGAAVQRRDEWVRQLAAAKEAFVH